MNSVVNLQWAVSLERVLNDPLTVIFLINGPGMHKSAIAKHPTG